MSFRLTFIIVVYLSLHHAAISDPVHNMTQPSTNEDPCKNSDFVSRMNLRSCVMKHLLERNAIRQIYNESRCPICAHVCSKSQIFLKCAYDAIDAEIPCNRLVREIGREFYRGHFESAAVFFCEGGGDRLTTFNDDEIMQCMSRAEGVCDIDILHERIFREDEGLSDSGSSSEEFTREKACRRLTRGVSCASRKAASCNEETANVTNSFLRYLKSSSPCSKFYA